MLAGRVAHGYLQGCSSRHDLGTANLERNLADVNNCDSPPNMQVVFLFSSLQLLNKSNPSVALKLMRTVSTAAFTKLQRMVLQKDPVGESHPQKMTSEQVILTEPATPP
jgi:hypothetical protein